MDTQGIKALVSFTIALIMGIGIFIAPIIFKKPLSKQLATVFLITSIITLILLAI